MEIKNHAYTVAVSAINRLRGRYGAMRKIAAHLGLVDQTVSKWKTVPMEYVFTIAAMFHIPPEQLRPDIFISDPLRAERAAAFVASQPKTVIQRVKRPAKYRLSERHREIWIDRDRFRTEAEAAEAIADDLGHYISVRTLQDRLGHSGRVRFGKAASEHAAGLSSS